jgi:hypothetical protein
MRKNRAGDGTENQGRLLLQPFQACFKHCKRKSTDGFGLSRRQTITVTQKYLSGITGRNEMVKNVTVIS